MIRVIQWGTGSVGRTCLRRIIDAPDLELVGVYVTNPTKVGRDAGSIARRPETGILATDNIEEILALDADVVLHTSLITVPYDEQNANVIRLLESGKSVISTNGFYRPDVQGPAYAEPLRAAALAGGATLAGSGLNPGFIAERIALVASGLVAQMDELRCYEVFDASRSPSAGLLFDAMGFNANPAEVDLTTSPLAKMYDTYYAETFDYVAEKLGLTVQSIEAAHEVTLAPEDMVLRAGVIEKGNVAATLWLWNGVLSNGIKMTHSILWTASHKLHDIEDGAHWRVEIDGRPGVRLSLDLIEMDPAAPPSRPAMDATGAILINAIPSVVAAAPGFYDLPTLLPYKAQ